MNTIIIAVGLGVVALAMGALVRVALKKADAPTMADPDMARRLARAIASDIALYHAEACHDVQEGGAMPAALATAVDEGRALFVARVPASSLRRLYDEAVNDLVLKRRS